MGYRKLDDIKQELSSKFLISLDKLNKSREDLLILEEELERNLDKSGEQKMESQPCTTPLNRPKYHQPEWHDYVMAQFVKEELDDKGNPKVDGLRRITELLLGEIVSSRPVTAAITNEVASVNWELTIAWRADIEEYLDICKTEPFPYRTFGAFVDACPANTTAPYSKFLSSIADTRAEAKTLRRALRLRVIAAEEAETFVGMDTSGNGVSDGSYKESDPASEGQKIQIKVLCERLGVDLSKLCTKELKKETALLNRADGSSLIQLLNKYQSNVKDNSEKVPEDVRVM